MIHPDRIGHIVLKVRSLERSRPFYTEVLGLEVMKELPQRRQTYVLKRGAYDARAEPVEPGTPERIFPFATDLPRNRLGLAKWMIDARNPLTVTCPVAAL